MAFGAMSAQAALLATLTVLLCADSDGPERSDAVNDYVSERGLWCAERADSPEELSAPEIDDQASEQALQIHRWPPGFAIPQANAAQPKPTTRRVLRVTAYCDRGLTAAGVPSGVGQCAAPADIPFGSVIYIPELQRSFVVTDRTARRFRHNTVDLFIPSQERCLQFGRHYLECRISKPSTPVQYGSPDLLPSSRRAQTANPGKLAQNS